jgi:hypothetical protein
MYRDRWMYSRKKSPSTLPLLQVMFGHCSLLDLPDGATTAIKPMFSM